MIVTTTGPDLYLKSNLKRPFKINWGVRNKNNKVEDNNLSSVYIGDLDEKVTERELTKTFLERFPSTVKSKIIVEKTNWKRNKCYGFVYFNDRNEAKQAIQTMNGFMIGDKQIKTGLGFCKDSPDNPQYHLLSKNTNFGYKEKNLGNGDFGDRNSNTFRNTPYSNFYQEMPVKDGFGQNEVRNYGGDRGNANFGGNRGNFGGDNGNSYGGGRNFGNDNRGGENRGNYGNNNYGNYRDNNMNNNNYNNRDNYPKNYGDRNNFQNDNYKNNDYPKNYQMVNGDGYQNNNESNFSSNTNENRNSNFRPQFDQNQNVPNPPKSENNFNFKNGKNEVYKVF